MQLTEVPGVACQANLRRAGYRSKRCQARITLPTTTTGVQCNLIDAPALQCLSAASVESPALQCLSAASVESPALQCLSTASVQSPAPQCLSTASVQSSTAACLSPALEPDESDSDSDEEMDDTKRDPDWTVDSDSDSDTDSEYGSDSSEAEDDEETTPGKNLPTRGPEQPPPPPHQDNKYILFRSCLIDLVRLIPCPSCCLPELTWVEKLPRAMLVLEATCKSCAHHLVWHSQPLVGDTPAGNILLSASILFAGATPGKVLRVLTHLGLASISRRTFSRHQKHILVPSVTKVWDEHQARVFAELREEGRPLILGIDGRADSPGFCAKFGSLSNLELVLNMVLDLQLVQV